MSYQECLQFNVDNVTLGYRLHTRSLFDNVRIRFTFLKSSMKSSQQEVLTSFNSCERENLLNFILNEILTHQASTHMGMNVSKIQEPKQANLM